MTPAAGTMTGPDAPPARVCGVDLGDGEVVLYTTRQHASVLLLTGALPSAVLAAFLWFAVQQKSSPMPMNIHATMWALALVPLIASLLRYALRRYVLTDRRVIVRDGKGFTQVAIGSVEHVESRGAAQEHKPGDVVFRTGAGVMVWTRVPRARRAAAIAAEAVARYGRG